MTMSNPPAVPAALLRLLLPADRARPCPVICWRNTAKPECRRSASACEPVVLATGRRHLAARLLVVRRAGGPPARRSRHLQYISRTLWCVVSRRPARLRCVRQCRRSSAWASLGSPARMAAGARSDGRADSSPHLGRSSSCGCSWSSGGTPRCTRSRRCSSPIPTGFRRGNGARIARTRHRSSVSIPIRPMRASSAGFLGQRRRSVLPWHLNAERVGCLRQYRQRTRPDRGALASSSDS